MKKPEISIPKVELPAPLLKRVLSPFYYFAQFEAAGGILLLAGTAVALGWANSPWSAEYFRLFQTVLTLDGALFAISKPLLLWINDGLMAIFFFVVGLEIKREILVGELASARRAAFPIAGALGGIFPPALIYFFFNREGGGAAGWGIPMATDIAFALGIAALLGKRVPLGLKVFLAALAIVDDIAAVLVIAVFYTAEVSLPSLAVAGGVLVVLMALNFSGAKHPLWFILPGLVLWLAFLKSGVHATIAGVLLAMTIPASRRIDLPAYIDHLRQVLETLRESMGAQPSSDLEQAAVQSIEDASEKVLTPLQRIEHALLPWVAFFIMPLFALANAGVAFTAGFSVLMEPVSFGIICGLVLGKPVGIFVFSWGAVALGLAALPMGVRWPQVAGVGLLGGIGFTMSLFIAGLAFEDAALLDSAKLGILCGSLVAGTAGFFVLRSHGSAIQEGKMVHPPA